MEKSPIDNQKLISQEGKKRRANRKKEIKTRNSCSWKERNYKENQRNEELVL